jgi:hypothetical protein
VRFFLTLLIYLLIIPSIFARLYLSINLSGIALAGDVSPQAHADHDPRVAGHSGMTHAKARQWCFAVLLTLLVSCIVLCLEHGATPNGLAIGPCDVLFFAPTALYDRP